MTDSATTTTDAAGVLALVSLYGEAFAAWIYSGKMTHHETMERCWREVAEAYRALLADNARLREAGQAVLDFNDTNWGDLFGDDDHVTAYWTEGERVYNALRAALARPDGTTTEVGE